jgi:hypothetical protein
MCYTLDTNIRFSKKGCPQVVDPVIHRHYRGITELIPIVSSEHDETRSHVTHFDPGDENKNKFIGWVDSDSGRDPDSRKSNQ